MTEVTLKSKSSGNNDINTNYIMSELLKNSKSIEELKNAKTSSHNSDNNENKLKELKDQINAINARIEKMKFNTSEQRIINSEMHEKEQDDSINVERQNINSTLSADANENLSKLNENMKIISQNLGYKATKEEVEAKNKQIRSEIEKLSDKFIETIKNMESRFKNNVGTSEVLKFNSNENNIVITSDVQEQVEKIAKEIFDKEISCCDFNNNDNFRDTQLRIDNNKIEIEKIYESIIDIRRNLIESSPYDRMIKESNDKIEINETSIKEIKIRLDEVIKN
jgi:DNA repair exonuclease SbcCD ATPase subunit